MQKNAFVIKYARCRNAFSKRSIVTDSNSPRPVSRSRLPDLKYSDDDLFNYHRGRFVCDEAYEMSQHHVRFDVNELARCAADAIGANVCVSVKKYQDGMCNKSMLLTMDDGSEVVAKVPNPNAGIPHYTTASEVATMDFVRNVLGTPVPKVLAWNSKAKDNTVGAEYIIMEKAQGIELGEKAWTSISFKRFGSLYYANDLNESSENEPLYADANGIDTIDERFAIGPSTAREVVDNGRATVQFDRGPYRAISSAHLWHGDLHVANIIVKPSQPTEVVSIIDWQSTGLSPLYFHARQPHLVDYDGPPVSGLERPQLPKDMSKLEANARKHAEVLYSQQSLCSLYNTLTYHENPKLYAALEFQQTTSYLLLLLARDLLIDGEASYLMQVAELQATWGTLPGAKGSIYPFAFSPEEREGIKADVEGVERGLEAMRVIKENINGLSLEHGTVRHEQYEETLDALAQMKAQTIETFAKNEHKKEVWQKMWPFQDRSLNQSL